MGYSQLAATPTVREVRNGFLPGALGEQSFVTLILDMVHLSTDVAGHKSLER